MSKTRRNLLEMNHDEAKELFLKPQNFFSANLPRYIDFSTIIDRANKTLVKSKLTDISVARNSLSKSENVNHRILANKDGSYAWRPLQILHPLVYVDLVNEITERNNWAKIKKQFKQMQGDEKIECISIPVESISQKSDKAETILNWWENLEQAQVRYALDFDYCIHADITDCYNSIYTHSIPWALHGKKWAKLHKQPSEGLGNTIDSKIQNMQNGQTNGIPQGSVLMDFIAEIVLGYADLLLLEKMKELNCTEFKVLRYRDDYRILSNSRDQTELIIKELSDILSTLNLRLNSSKTFLANDVVLSAIKPDKSYWDIQHASIVEKDGNDIHFKISIQKHLLQIRVLGEKFPNCGSLNKALSEVYEYRVEPLKVQPNDIYQLISMVVGIMVNNPRTLDHCTVMLGKLFEFIKVEEIEAMIDKILEKYNKIPNTDLVEVWLQRLSLINTRNKSYNANICKKVIEPSSIALWNSEWLKKGFNESGIIDEEYIGDMNLTTSVEEVKLFASVDDEIYPK